MKRIAYLIILALPILSCAPKPIVVDVTQTKDLYLDCAQLNAAISSAELYKKEARKDDRFMLRYIFPPTAVTAMYRFNKAEGNAIKRIQYLENLASVKNCNTNVRTQPTNTQMREQYRQNQYNNNREPIFVPQNRGY